MDYTSTKVTAVVGRNVYYYGSKKDFLNLRTNSFKKYIIDNKEGKQGVELEVNNNKVYLYVIRRKNKYSWK